jgi:heme exporter protein A
MKLPGTGAVQAADGAAFARPSLTIEARALTVSFGEELALRRVALRVEAGARLALVGPNGAGKTTLLRVVAGLLRPASGEVRLGGASLADDREAARRSIGFVGHHSLLYPELTAWENLQFYARLYRVPDRSERVVRVLEQMGLYGRRHDRLATLSRGMIQRLALARAILHEPPVLLLDEPDAGLDVEAFATLERTLRDDPRRTVVLTTHDFGHALRLCDRVAILDRGRVAAEAATADLDLDALRRRYAATTGRAAGDAVAVPVPGGLSAP